MKFAHVAAQVQVLLDAYSKGAPFCEACFKKQMEEAMGAASPPPSASPAPQAPDPRHPPAGQFQVAPAPPMNMAGTTPAVSTASASERRAQEILTDAALDAFFEPYVDLFIVTVANGVFKDAQIQTLKFRMLEQMSAKARGVRPDLLPSMVANIAIEVAREVVRNAMRDQGVPENSNLYVIADYSVGYALSIGAGGVQGGVLGAGISAASYSGGEIIQSIALTVPVITGAIDLRNRSIAEEYERVAEFERRAVEALKQGDVARAERLMKGREMSLRNIAETQQRYSVGSVASWFIPF
jgi:hypothetical protein